MPGPDTIGIATLTMNPALDFATTTPQVEPTRKLRCSEPVFGAGGGGINVARVVNMLGGDAVAIFPSGGPPGAHIERLLTVDRLPFRAIPIGGFTRESISVDASDTGEQYRFVLPGPNLSESELCACIDAVSNLRDKPRFLVVSGSMPPGVSGAFLRRLAAQCRVLDIPMVLDTSGPALAACEGLGAALIKPSLCEMQELLGHDIAGEEAEEAAARDLIERRFADAVVLSLGVRGALLVTRETSRRYPPIPGPIRSAVGAGDAMVGAIVLGLSRGIALGDTVAIGVDAGAAALITAGESVGFRADLVRLRKMLNSDG